jgi:uncharacterized membrane protein YjjP (DUF1212 family)
MASEECSDLILAFARVLYVNGYATSQTVDAAERLARILGVSAKVTIRWGKLELQSADKSAGLTFQVTADPTGVDMNRVALTMSAIEQIEAGRLAPDAGLKTIGSISQAPPPSVWLFALAAGAGAVALAVIFGVSHLFTAVVIFVSAATGAILRCGLAQWSANLFVQPFSAALVAGVIGAIVSRYELSPLLGNVALCPCIVLVPGPHVLNGAIDLINGRIPLGAARLIYAGLVILAISMGLLIGLTLLGATLPIDDTRGAAPLWQDAIAAGVAVAAYSVFVSAPFRLLPVAVAVGVLAHMLRWAAVTEAGFSVAASTLFACLVVGLILIPVSQRRRVPFAAIGFAAVAPMMPGAELFRMAGGLVEIAHVPQATLAVLSATISDGTTAMIVILAMTLGLIVPKIVVDHFSEKSPRAQRVRINRYGGPGAASRFATSDENEPRSPTARTWVRH